LRRLESISATITLRAKLSTRRQVIAAMAANAAGSAAALEHFLQEYPEATGKNTKKCNGGQGDNSRPPITSAIGGIGKAWESSFSKNVLDMALARIRGRSWSVFHSQRSSRQAGFPTQSNENNVFKK
jgi:hypothetical protein